MKHSATAKYRIAQIFSYPTFGITIPAINSCHQITLKNTTFANESIEKMYVYFVSIKFKILSLQNV